MNGTITTGLLDTVEDTKATYETEIKGFMEVADAVDGVTKISALEEKALEKTPKQKILEN